MKTPKTSKYFTQKSPSLITIANLFRHSVTTIITRNSTRKLRDIRKIADGPMHSNPLCNLTRTLRKTADTASTRSIR